MKLRFVVYLFIVCLLLSIAHPSLSQDIMFNRVPPPSSTYSGGIAGVQDPQGYMWFAYLGLHRYDGYKYTSYFTDPLNPNSLAGNIIESLCIGRNGIIWVGTFGNGLDRLDPVTGIFTHFRHDPKKAASLTNDTVSAILEDREGIIWVGTKGGFNRFDPKTGIFTRYLHNPADSSTLSHNQVRVIYEDRQGTLWVGTGSAFAENPTKGGGLNRMDRKKGTFTRYLHDPDNPKSLIDSRVRAIFEDSHGIFWIGTAGDGLHTMDRAKGTFERHRYDPAQPEKLSRPPQKKRRPRADDHITFIIEDATGAIWIGTFENGINRYDPETKKIRHFPPFKDKVTGLQVFYTWWASASRDGLLWFGYWGEACYRVDPLRRSIPYFETGRPVLGIYEDNSGVLWLAGNPGLVRKDIKGTEQQFIYDSRNPLSLSNNTVHSIYEDRDGVLWIGTDNGLNRFDQETGTFTRYVPRPRDDSSLTSGVIFSICEDKDGSLWIGTNVGLNRMNRQTGTFTPYFNNPRDSISLSKTQIKRIYEDRSRNLWIGTWQRGLNRLTPQTGKIQRFLDGTNVNSLLEDSEGILWVGTSNGLYRSNPAVDSFSRFSDSGGTLARDIIIAGVMEDNQKALWINTSLGILKLNPQRNEVVIYGENHGVNTSSFTHNPGYYKGRSGRLYFGRGSGYNTFFPEQLMGNTTPPQIVISDFRLADQQVMPGEGSPLREPLSQAKEIRLKYNQNVFSFDFAGIHYSSPEENRHLFTLEKLDNTWREGGEEKTAYYYNVPPGRYVFRVKAANNNGIWAEKSIAVIIAPPWWKTTGAYVLFGLMFIVVAYAIYRIQRRRLLAAEREKAREHELAQAKEIEKAYKELKTTQAQLIQREKMASLGELTAGIAHEIQNPLNFINNFSDINNELIEEMKNEFHAGNKEGAFSIADDIKENEQKINHHGKRADAIVKGMLQHSRSSTGQKEFTDINALADEYLRLSYHGLRAKDKSLNATINTGFDTSIGKINIIPQDIGRVLLNLYNNAFYAVTEKKKQHPEARLPNGQGYEPMVSVSTNKVNDKIEIRVRDNGNGIPEKVLDKVFQPFFTTKPTGQGTGLGLSLAYDIIKAHGGEMKVDTKQGEFAEFVIQLPGS